MPKQDFDSASLPRDDTTVQPKSALPHPSQLIGIKQQSPAVSPAKEPARPSSTPAQVFPEPPRQVPAKRSNIMNILNDDAEEPPSRKKFASDQSSAANTPQLYSISHSMSQQSQLPPREESVHSSRQLQHQRSHYLPQQSQVPQQNQLSNTPSRSYPEYSSYSVGSVTGSGTATQDWMARLDPRGQQQSQATDHGLSRLPAQQAPSLGYMSTAQQATNSGSNLHQQAQQQHRSSYNPQPSQPVQQSQPAGFQGQSQHQSNINLGKRDSPLTLQAQPFHPSSPQHRHTSVPYSRRTSQQQQQPSSPLHISASALPQTQQHSSYTQSHLSQPPQRQHHSSARHQLGHNPQHNGQSGSGSQHMQHIVPPTSPHHHPTSSLRQSQQQQHQHQPRHHQQQQQHHPQHISPLGLGNQHSTSSFGHNPSHLQPAHRTSSNISISSPNPHQNANLGRPYTPPSALHQPSPGGPSYSSGIVAPHPNQGPQQQGLHPMHQHQHPNQHQHQQLHSRLPGPTHHRAYSQDSRQ
ncbi:uncharacterized protein BDCG_16334 [Blastomyces dermatitidis ER-3]|nr:uncharacterized protein BDCG_16334 [Blastomyces dermatitidis ER-3]OAS99822.1 hypothetical protein BDCG_16334 [Blastomyces dermatitidis ER-3]